MKRTALSSLIGLLFASPAFSAENIELNDVVVTATRTPQPREAVIADVTVIDREQIERAGASSLTDILRAQPGVQISTNGGAGTASSVFLRGTNSDHVVVLVDGLRINSATLGTTSFENLPINQIERIEILRGPASSLYGADAIGGVIQIFTRKAEADKLLAHAAVGLGTYDTKTAEAGVSGSAGALKYGINVSSLDTEGFSAKRIRTGKDADDDSYRNLSVSAFAELELAPGHSWGLQFFESKGHNEFDGNNFENYGKQTLQSYAFTSKNRFTDFWHSTFKLGLGIDDSTSHSAFSNPAKFRTEQQQLTWQNDFKLPLGTLTLAYDRLEQDVKTTDTGILGIKKERNDDSFIASYFSDIGNHSLQLSLRENHNTQFGNYTTGGAGYAYRITPQWRVSGSYGKAFKVPTFNQLYFPDFGDPKLRSERSENVEASLKYSGERFNAGVTLFENHIRDLIAFTGSASLTCASFYDGFCPENIGKAKLKGATLDAGWQVMDTLMLSGNLTVQSPREKLTGSLAPRRGNRYGAINLLHTLGDWQWGAEVTGASTRYNDLANTKKMSGYMLLNFTASYQLAPEWKLNLRADNVLDKNYVLAFTGNSASAVPYNTAGSNLFIGLRYDMKP